jgi:hypothetical protein
MSMYKLADILAQEIPDHLMLDIALHLQANDNHSRSRSVSGQSEQLNHAFGPEHPGRTAGGSSWLPHGSRVHDRNERLEALWIWCRAAATSFVIDLCLASALDGQPG